MKKTFILIILFVLSVEAVNQNTLTIDWPVASYTNAVKMLQKKGNANKTIAYLQKEMEPPFPYQFVAIMPTYVSKFKKPEICSRSIPNSANEKEKKDFIKRQKAALINYHRLIANEYTNKLIRFDKYWPKNFKVGYYYYKLLGKACDRAGMTADALACFLTSLSFIPDKLTTTASKKSIAQCYLDIGNNYMKVKRYLDAESYFKSARIICPSNAVINRSAISKLAQLAARNNEFEDAIKLYKELNESYGMKSPYEYITYAGLLFNLGRNSEGFSVLEEGITATFISSNKAEKDPVILFYIERMPLASDDDISNFYNSLNDLLGMIQLKGGMEKSIAFLINERSLLTKIFDFLIVEEDLQRIKEEIDTMEE